MLSKYIQQSWIVLDVCDRIFFLGVLDKTIGTLGQ
jgi:hypothetical protein